MRLTKLKYYSGLLLIAMVVLSCKKVISLDLGNDSGKLVIEANITDESGPQYVKLSRNAPFTSTNTYPPVTGANVTIYDSTANLYFDMVENSAGTYSVNKGVGVLGHTYFLTVNTGGQTYNARSIMPQHVAMDSVATSSNLLDKTDNKRMMTVYFNDPAGVKNQYRFVMYVNKVQVNYIFAFDDQFIDGKHVTLDLQQSEKDIFPGDTVRVEMQNIDRPVYTYWFTLEQQQGNNPGGAVAPSNPPTNIAPSVLGYFSAHTTQSITVVAK
ncbi:DUF4249 domain-containing protein [Mucilaginibacter sp. BT774]|uniref:DUF4249 domain-containing protein n=1 Tax=Mucilaginibacter sp. BT774 TaxID=3062276 RepID=UPI0026750585|nr:DUF4249 domain-containing protein [Mucilaginibacter sp. BT774]MDO3625900.1 DUF4249 domain-containing protein [Mucilaginibacter sp. BT774]